ncbi:MAG: hypothetical protein ACKOXK_01910 [Chakrabartia sp.]
MPSAALILASFDDDAQPSAQPLLLTLGGQTLLERLIDQACRVGCDHVIVCAGPLPGALAASISRSKAKGCDVRLARSPREAADLLHPQEQVLLFGTAFVMPDAPLIELLAERWPMLLTLPEAWGRDRFERIDGIDNWAGVALVPAALVRDTVAMLGDWSFGPTLLRRAVQTGLPRRPLGVVSEAEADDIAPIQRDDLAGTARALVRAARVATDGLLERAIILPLMRALAGAIALRRVTPNMMALLALLLGLVGLGVAGLGLAALAMILIALTAFPALLCGVLGQVGTPAHRWLEAPLRTRRFWVPLACLVLAGRLSLTEDPLQPMVLLLVWLAVQQALLLQLAGRMEAGARWWIGGAGIAIIFAIAAVLGVPLPGLALCLFVSLAAQLSTQARINRL